MLDLHSEMCACQCDCHDLALFWADCLDSTLVARSGMSYPNCNLIQQSKSNSAGDTPVVECGVIRYWNSILAIQLSIDPVLLAFFIPSLKVFTALSANPLDKGW